jgi:hypothetical protein
MTSFIAAGGSGRSTSFIPAGPAAWSVTTIAFIDFICAVTKDYSFVSAWTPHSTRARFEHAEPEAAIPIGITRHP